MKDRFQCLNTLSLKPNASKAEIKQAYYDLVKVWHPDRFTHDPVLAGKAQEKLKEINEAYTVLMSLPDGAPSNPFGAARGGGRGRAFYDPGPQRVVRRPSVWMSQSFALIFVLLFTTLLFKLVLSVFRGSFHNPSPGKTVRDIV